MKYITISMDDGLSFQDRMKATDTEFQRLAREEQELRAELDARHIGLNPANNLTRDELHDRDALR
ncbi:MAG TPA: hypothetical protein DIT64_01785 [Verrucomicrobiales bacterium]|nr:hypothetical protein [Verrucomicrobiales bacterium]HRJ09095.1 hypothetical protein [Prosthecobacter sp.]HRK14637.1 hypothetical protein [Prosthecobacter sp.]